MKTVLVRYKTTAAHADANAALVGEVFAELHRSTPAGLRYASYRFPDGVTFLHVATHADPNPLTSLPQFRAFQEKLRGACDEPPVVTEVSTVGAYEAAT
ncbi:MAG: hypothetical protein JNL79_20215 [Myxococcales bacterium]|nr:hypothetical protein [Myxococcales bacterium]